MNKINHQKIENYYDDFLGSRTKLGINDRVYQLFKKMRKSGLSSTSHVLELGCGIGTLTFLLSKIVKKGSVEAVDISPKSVDFAKSKIKRENIAFYTGDVVNYKPNRQKYDFITLFDVIEHIPIEKHSDLFFNISLYADDKTLILINIPNPDYIEYDRKNSPEVLQIIDQPLPLPIILNNLEKCNLEIIFFETYSIWVENDYQFFIIRKKRAFNNLRHNRDFYQKIVDRIKKLWISINYTRH